MRTHHFSVGIPFVGGETYAERRHRSENGHHRLDRVRINDRFVLFEVFGREAAVVNDPVGWKENAEREAHHRDSRGENERLNLDAKSGSVRKLRPAWQELTVASGPVAGWECSIVRNSTAGRSIDGVQCRRMEPFSWKDVLTSSV